LSITGSVNSSKEAVAEMLQRLLKFDDMPTHLDATDGLAAAMCHIFQANPRGFGDKSSKTSRAKKSSSWENFVNNNKSRVK